MAFLKVIEERINNGDLQRNIMDIQMDKNSNLNYRSHHEQMVDDVFQKSRDKLKELQHILGKITSLRNGRGGDVFFKGLAKTFQTNPIIPPDHYYTNYDHLLADDEIDESVTFSP